MTGTFFTSGYGKQALDRWAQRVDTWARAVS